SPISGGTASCCAKAVSEAPGLEDRQAPLRGRRHHASGRRSSAHQTARLLARGNGCVARELELQLSAQAVVEIERGAGVCLVAVALELADARRGAEEQLVFQDRKS